MKIEKNVLIMSSFPNKITKLFDETFNTFKSYEQENVEKFIESLSDKIEAIAVMGGTTVSSELIKKLPKLKIIANYGVGYDAVDVKQATLSNVKVTNTPDVLNDEVADTAIWRLDSPGPILNREVFGVFLWKRNISKASMVHTWTSLQFLSGW